MEDIVYSEWVPAGMLMKILAGSVSLLTLCVLLITISVGVALQNPFLITVLASTLLFLFWNYRGIQIQVTVKELIINYGFFNHKHIPISNIISCEHTKALFRKYGGVGVRYCLTDRSWAYTTSFGDAVKITRRKGRSFVFSSNNPEQLCSLVNERTLNRQF